MIKKIFSNKKRSYWRGLFAGVLAYLLTTFVFIIVFIFIKPFVWFAFTSDPYPSSDMPVDPESIEWLILQGLNFITWFVAGVAVARWSQPKSNAALMTLATTIVILTLFDDVLATESTFRLAIWFLFSPLAIIIGNRFYIWRETREKLLLST